MSTEQELIQRASRFDLQALGEIYDRFSPSIYRYALRFLGNADSAEDCVAQVFERFLQALKSGKGPKQYIRAYLYRMAHNAITDQYRRAPLVLPLEMEHLSDGTPTAQELINDKADAECLRQAIDELTPEQRQVIILKYLADLTNEEVAAAMCKPVGAIKSMQHRALASLHRALRVEERR